MDRDTFWEIVRDVLGLFIKVVATLTVLQIIIMLLNYKFKMPFIYDLIQKALINFRYYVH